MKWHICGADSTEAGRLAREAGIHPVVARILLARNISDPSECNAFLQPRLDNLHSPALLPDIDRAVSAITSAVKEGKVIQIYGDYDADGITGTALLVALFRLLGTEPRTYIPDRIKEGYGLNTDAARSIAETRPGLVITVDCGTSDGEAVEILKQSGAEVVVIDHHEPGDPASAVIVNPKRADSRYPFRDLASVGVVFKVAWAVAEEMSPSRKMSREMRDFLIDSLGLVAIGTVADVVPLVGENRILAAFGLSVLKSAKSIGLKTLLRTSGIGDRMVKAHDIAFRVAPRLNAIGRLKEAGPAVKLLTTSSREEAEELSSVLEQINAERQRIQKQILKEALEMASNRPEPNVVVLASPNWHVGVVGIGASKVLDRFYLPTILLSVDGDIARGSARSIPGFNIFDALGRCSDLLLKWGGHALAAGLTLEASNVRPLAERLSALAAEQFGGEMPERLLEIDAEVSLGDLDMEVVKGIERMSPFGSGNRRPILAVKDVKVAGAPRRIGANRNHAAFHLSRDGTTLRAVWWDGAEHIEDLKSAGRCDAAFVPKIATWKGASTVELDIKDIHLI